jgi:hypothetical protein
MRLEGLVMLVLEAHSFIEGIWQGGWRSRRVFNLTVNFKPYYSVRLSFSEDWAAMGIDMGMGTNSCILAYRKLMENTLYQGGKG